jgi:translocation and assembly module TamB
VTQRHRRGPFRALLAVCLVLTALLLALRTEQAADNACALARRHLPLALGLDVGIGRCTVDPVSQTVQLFGVSLFEPGADTPLVAADEAEVSFAGVRPFSRVVELAHVRLVRPRVSLDLSRPGPGGESRCSLEPLRRLDIHRLEIRNAEVRLVLPDGRAVELLDGEVTWRKRRGRAEIRLQALRGSFTARPGVELELASLSLDARFDPANERVEITRAELELDGFSLNGAGDISRLCDPELALEASAFVPVHTVARLAGWDAQVEGHLWARASVSGAAARPEVGVELAGSEVKVDRYHPGTFDLRGRLSGDVLRIDAFQTALGQGVLRAQATLTLNERLPLQLTAELDRGELGPALARAGLPGAWVNFPASGKAKLSGTLLPAPALRGDFELKAGRFVLGTRPWDRPQLPEALLLTFAGAEVQGALAVHPDRVELEGIRADTGRSTVVANATLWYAPHKGLLVRGEAPELDLADFGHIARIPWRGRAAGQFQVAGPYDQIKAVAQVSLRDFDFWKFSLGGLQGRVEYAGDTLSFPAVSGQKGKLSYTGKGDLVFGKGPMRARGTAYLVGGRLEDLVDALLPMHPNMDHFAGGTLTGEVAGVVEVDCPADAFAATVDLQLANTRYFDRGLGDGRVVLRFVEGDRAVLDRTVLVGPLGVTEVAGTWHFDGPLDYRFSLDGNLAEVVGAARAADLELDGKLQLRGRVGGDADAMTVSAWLTSPQVRFGGRSLGPSHLEARLTGDELHLWGRPFDGTTAQARMVVKAPYPWKLSTHLSLPELRPLLPEAMAAQGVTGSLAGSVEARGDLRDGKALEAIARLDRLALSRGDFTAQNDGRVDLSYKAGRLSVESFAFRGPNTRLSVAGSAGPRALDLKLHGTADVRLVESFVPWFERSAGRLEVAAATGGTFAAPTLAGSATLTDLRFNLRDHPVAVRGLSGRVEFSERRIVAQSVRGALNDGRVDLEADVRLDGFAPGDLQIRMLLDEVSFRPVDELPLTASGELNLSGRPDALTLAGNVDLVRLRYEQPLVLDDLLTEVRAAKVGGGGGGEARKEWLHFDLLVKASGDVRVDNNLARARLRGDVRLTGSNLRPGLLGSVETLEGGELFFRGNTFQVAQGIIEFKDRREVDPVFDLHAQTQVREYLVSLHGFGRVKDPQLTLTSEPELQEADILSLLTIGVTSRDRSDALGTALVGAAAGEALFSASGLDRQVQRFLPRNPLLRDLSFHISSTYNEASGGVEPTAHFETRLVKLPLELAMTQPVVTTRGTRARLEYRFDQRLSGQLQWDDDRGENLPNFGLDLKLRWEVE